MASSEGIAKRDIDRVVSSGQQRCGFRCQLHESGLENRATRLDSITLMIITLPSLQDKQSTDRGPQRMSWH